MSNRFGIMTVLRDTMRIENKRMKAPRRCSCVIPPRRFLKIRFFRCLISSVKAAARKIIPYSGSYPKYIYFLPWLY